MTTLTRTERREILKAALEQKRIAYQKALQDVDRLHTEITEITEILGKGEY